MRSARRIHRPDTCRKIIYGGCGLAYVQKLPPETSCRILARAGLPEGSTQEKEVRLASVMKEMLYAMDLRSNGEGAGVAFARASSALQKSKGFPASYTLGEDNIFTLTVITPKEESIIDVKRSLERQGFAILRNRPVEIDPMPRDIMRGSLMYELAVIVKPEQEARFVQCINTVNANGDASIISSGVNSGMFKIVGRIDELFEAFPALTHADRNYYALLGHVRYPTNTPNGILTAQPHCSISYDGSILYMFSAQNGEVTNNDSLRAWLSGERYFQIPDISAKISTRGRDGFSTMLTASDGETIPHIINFLRAKGCDPAEIAEVLSGKRDLPFGNGMLGMSGPLAVVAMGTPGIIAFKDSRRLRPLVAGIAAAGRDAYLLFASEEGAIRRACRANGLTTIAIQEVREFFAGEKGAIYEQVAGQLCLPDAAAFAKDTDSSVAEITATNVIELDIGRIRGELETMPLGGLFKQALYPGDNGKFFDDRQTYVHRLIARRIRTAVLERAGAEGLRNGAETAVVLKDVCGERNIAVGMFNWLESKAGGEPLPAPLRIKWQTQGTAGDNLGAFCSNATSIDHYGNSGEGTANTARGLDLTIHGSSGSSLCYASSEDTRVFVEKRSGVRTGAYMKGTKEKSPRVVIGETSAEFCGECAHNGIILVLNRNNDVHPVGRGVGAGIEGKARVIIRGDLNTNIPKGARAREPDEGELHEIGELVSEYCRRFKCEHMHGELAGGRFTVIEKNPEMESPSSVHFAASKDDIPFGPEELRVIYAMSGVKNGRWDPATRNGVRLAKGMGHKVIKTSLNAAQITAPAIDKREEEDLGRMLRIPLAQQNVEGQRIEDAAQNGDSGIFTTGIIIGSQSYGALGELPWMNIYEVSRKLGIMMGSGEGGLPPVLGMPDEHLMVQLASGRFGTRTDAPSLEVNYFKNARIVEIKIGQGGKPGEGGALPAEKLTREIAATRGVEDGTNAVSPPSHHDAYSIEAVKALIEMMRFVAGDNVKIAVKFAATNDLEQIVCGLVKGGANIINIGGGESGTGYATRESNLTGVPALEAVERAHNILLKEGLRNYVTLVVSGGFYDAKGVIEAMAHGANAVEMASAVDVAMGCTECQDCNTSRCKKGITTQNSEGLEPHSKERLETYLRSLFLGIRDILQQNGVTKLSQATGNKNLLRKKRG